MTPPRQSAWARLALHGFCCALLGLGLAACDDLTLGQVAETSAAPRLVRVTVEEASGFLIDLLNRAAPRKCSHTAPCPIDFRIGDVAQAGCQIAAGATEGVCPNPLAAGPVQLPFAGGAGRITVRWTFSKLIDTAIETVQHDADGTTRFRLIQDIVGITDANDQLLSAYSYFDPAGTPATPDPLAVPFGPALVLVPDSPVSIGQTYSLRFEPTHILDRRGQALTDGEGAALPSPLLITFTTVEGPPPDLTMRPADMAESDAPMPIDSAVVEDFGATPPPDSGVSD